MKSLLRLQNQFKSCTYINRLISKILVINNKLTEKDKIDLKEVKKAIYYAKNQHGSQMRESGHPYYTHPIEVAYMVADYCLETNAIVAAILHDVVEDTDATIEDLANIFGSRVAQIVERLTRFELAEGKLSSGELLIKAYRLNDPITVLIKLLDRIHNLQTIKIKSNIKQEKNYLEVLETFFVLSFKIDHTIVNKFYDYLKINATQKQEHSIFSYGTYQLQFPTFQNNF